MLSNHVYFQFVILNAVKENNESLMVSIKADTLGTQLQLEHPSRFGLPRNQAINYFEEMQYITVFFLVASAMLLTHSFAAPITAESDLSILPAAHSRYLGHIQQDSVTVPDPGFAKLFDKIYTSFYTVIAKAIKNSNRDPKKVEILKEYIKRTRALASPIAKFVRQYYPDDTAANNIINVIEKFLSSLDKLIEEPGVSRKDTAILAKLMKMLN